MIQYLQILSPCTDDYLSFTAWFCDELRLLDKDICNVIYLGSEDIAAYCIANGIADPKLLSRYVSVAKSELKNMFLASLRYMKNKSMLDYKFGYKFFYQMNDETIGYVGTDVLNDDLIANETTICNDMNEEHGFSDKMKGRQNLLLIYGNKMHTQEFDTKKCQMIMNDGRALKKLNSELDHIYGNNSRPIDWEHPLINYYKGIMITECNSSGNANGDDSEKSATLRSLACQISDALRERTRKRLMTYHYRNKITGKTYHPFSYLGSSTDLDKLERLMFHFHPRIKDITWSESDENGKRTPIYHLSNFLSA